MEKRSLISTRYTVSKKDKRLLIRKVRDCLGGSATEILKQSRKVEKVKTRIDNVIVIMVDSKPLFILMGEEVHPTIVGHVKFGIMVDIPIVYVDSGAVPHILNGADVMAPGIVRITGEMSKGDIVYIGEDENKRIFGAGKALMEKDEIFSLKRGKAIKNVHYAGDKVWDLIIRELL